MKSAYQKWVCNSHWPNFSGRASWGILGGWDKIYFLPMRQVVSLKSSN